MAATRQHFSLSADSLGEFSIETDPREASAETIAHLRAPGFHRLSLGVQYFDPQVQQAINRIQPLGMAASVMSAARAVRLSSDWR